MPISIPEKLSNEQKLPQLALNKSEVVLIDIQKLFRSVQPARKNEHNDFSQKGRTKSKFRFTLFDRFKRFRISNKLK